MSGTVAVLALARSLRGLHLGPQTVLQTFVAAVVLSLIWGTARVLARQGVPWARRVVRVLGPYAAALRVRLSSAPMTVLYVASWSVTSVIQQGTPESIQNLVDRYNSTNLTLLAHNPVRVLFSSAFLVADRALGYTAYVVAYVAIVAALEHALGWRRLLVVWLVAHVLGSLATALTETLLIDSGTLAKSYTFASDVGVSYVLVGSCAAFVVCWRNRSRWVVLVGLSLALLIPLALTRTIWDLGHCYAAILGAAAGWLVTRGRPLARAATWRELVSVQGAILSSDQVPRGRQPAG